eukprot:TRINITY_DN35453_c0_g1_i1.p2 TRINITY_DN35453_c0_g1~~TRINITY_DN35453_c0_g1_i1.p2  ORF type:complete len:172 (-),score=12.83 TRINITY_DN35453_c0_g1_i1:166-681(-)
MHRLVRHRHFEHRRASCRSHLLRSRCGGFGLANFVLVNLVKHASLEELECLRRRALYLYAMVVLALPILSPTYLALWLRIAIVGVIAGLRTATSFVFFVSNASLLNSVSAGRIATAQSIRMAFGSLMQVMGPPLGSVTYAWFATNNSPFPFDESFPFFACAIGSLFLALAS